MKVNWVLALELGALAFLSIPLSFSIYNFSSSISFFIEDYLSVVFLVLLIIFTMWNLSSAHQFPLTFRKIFAHVLISILIYTAIQLIFTFVYLTYFNPSYSETLISRHYKPLPSDTAAQTVGQRLGVELLYSSEGIVISKLLINLFGGVLLTLILWVIRKRKLPATYGQPI